MFDSIDRWNHNQILETFINESVDLSIKLFVDYIVQSKLKLLYFSAILVKKPMLYLFLGSIAIMIANIMKKIEEKKKESGNFKGKSYSDILKDIFSLSSFIKDFDLSNEEMNEIKSNNLDIKNKTIIKNFI